MSRPRLIGLLLALLTLLAYLPVAHHGFLYYDDNDYVTENTVVQKGLTWAGVQWAFTHVVCANWHPLTMLSHMTDCELFGLNAGAQHFVNVLFHTANTVLLFLLLLRLTGDLWPSAFVAALFAWHPLHVESVAWIAERKDVLSTFFALLALLAYTRYVSESKGQSPKSKVFYGLTLLLFALGLMSKPMLVTLPCVMLLLDYWPLQRFQDYKLNVATAGRLALEKWPFFLLAAVSCVATCLAQYHGQAVMTFQRFPLHLRIANALIAYALYLLKTVWPSGLAVLYPLPKTISWLAALVAAVILLALSAAAWRERKRHPYGLTGWLWFLGMLVPVIGLVQVGAAALADRYTYLPLVGVFLVVAFGIRDLARRFQLPNAVVAAAAIAVLAGCLALTENQLRYWRDNETLFTRALAVTKDNHVAHVDLGVALEQKGELAQALAEYRIAEQLAPDMYHIHNNLGHVLDRMGRSNEALAEYEEAVFLGPDQAPLHNRTGAVLAELGRFDEALREFNEAARLDPVYAPAPFETGKLRLQQGRDAEAIDEFRAALRIDPDNFQILAYTAHVLASIDHSDVRDGKSAFTLAAKAKALTGDTQPDVLDALGMACAEMGHFDEAQTVAQKALEIAQTAKVKNLEPLRKRLELYQNHQPWRESFLATNPPLKTPPRIGPH